ncbi:MAG: zinc ribbon domain-containing protein [bacterium]
MVNCPYPKCGREVEPAPNFCPSCYEKIILCPICRTTNRNLATFCHKCGRELQESPDYKMYKANPQLTGFSPVNSPPEIEELNLQWQTNINAEVFSSLTTAYGYIFVCSKDGIVHILRQSNGQEICRLSIQEPHETNLTPAIFNWSFVNLRSH